MPVRMASTKGRRDGDDPGRMSRGGFVDDGMEGLVESCPRDCAGAQVVVEKKRCMR